MPPKGNRGGKRQGAGRKRTTPLPKIRRDVAIDVLEALNEQANIAKCTREAQFWFRLLAAEDKRLQYDVIRYLKECVDGKPKQRVDPLSFDPNAPLRVLVEHIGRPVRS